MKIPCTLPTLRWGLAVVAVLLSSTPQESRAGVQVGVGGYTELMDSLQNTSKAGKNGSIDPAPAFTLGYDKRLGSDESARWTYNPEFIFVQLVREADHDTYLVTLNNDVTYAFGEIFRLRGGLGVLFRRISGAGGPVSTNNGTSLATFFAPSKTETSTVLSLNLGFEFLIARKVGLRAELFVVGLLGGPARHLNNLISASYFF